ncbi:hypothetical protein TNCV_3420371 [Trichonephila clavipes]|nr:hypothetical protein TNCV_3420371 [Trichonephila clavipes]
MTTQYTVYAPCGMIVRVHYFVRGGSVRHRSRASSKHLSPHLPVGELDSSGGQTGVALHLQMHVWVSVYKETNQMLLFSRSDVTRPYRIIEKLPFLPRNRSSGSRSVWAMS